MLTKRKENKNIFFLIFRQCFEVTHSQRKRPRNKRRRPRFRFRPFRFRGRRVQTRWWRPRIKNRVGRGLGTTNSKSGELVRGLGLGVTLVSGLNSESKTSDVDLRDGRSDVGGRRKIVLEKLSTRPRPFSAQRKC